MPTPPLSPELMQEAVDLWLEYGKSVRAAADASGLNYHAYCHRLEKAKKLGMHLDPAIRQRLNDHGVMTTNGLHSGWLELQDENGKKTGNLYFQVGKDEPQDLLERIRAAFEGMEPAPPIAAPASVMADLCSVYPLMDVHLGMHAWGRETGSDDYDLKLALGDMRHAFAKVLAITPQSDTGVLIIGGDFFHADNNNAETPASRHKLDVDGRFDKVVDGGMTILVETIDRLLTRHASVIVRALRGNHDENAFRILRVGLAAWYRNEPRVTIDAGPRDLFMYQWGRCAVFAHHGDKAKPQQAALYVSDICPFWSETRHRHFLTGHVHHDQAKDVGPLRWESLRAFCPPDAYAASMGYGARRALQSLTFHKQDGLVLRAMDPIERAA